MQRDARVAHAERRSFRAVLDADPEVAGALGGPDEAAKALDEAFDLTRSLTHVRRTFDALEKVAG